MIKIGLIGFGKAGQSVAQILLDDDRFQLCWIARHTAEAQAHLPGRPEVPFLGLSKDTISSWLDQHPVDALVDFSHADAIEIYGPQIERRHISLVSAISAYTDQQLHYIQELGRHARVLCSPNITLGINFLMMSCRLLRSIAPFADVEIIEQHFREKPEVSGTARKIAQSLSIEAEHITSLRVGGIVGHHEVIFGFPHQTVRLIHDSIRREAFGTGAAFALSELVKCPWGVYSFDDLLMKKIRSELLASGPGSPAAQVSGT